MQKKQTNKKKNNRSRTNRVELWSNSINSVTPAICSAFAYSQNANFIILGQTLKQTKAEGNPLTRRVGIIVIHRLV